MCAMNSIAAECGADRAAARSRKTRVAVIFGGCSPEHEVSLQSAAAVIENLDPGEFEAVPVGITKDGRWLRYEGGPERIADGSWTEGPCRPARITPDRGAGLLADEPVDLAFPVLHGRNGEDGTVQGLLELSGVPAVGCGTLASAICMDKDRAHRLVRLAGVEVPRGRTFRRREMPSDGREAEKVLRAAAEEFALHAGGQPELFVKPLRAGSSFGITKVRGAEALPAAVHAAFEYDDEVIVEEAVPGFEVGCAVMDGPDGPFCGRVDEIELADGFFDFREKYTLETSKIHCPARIDELTEKRVQKCAKVIWKALGCSGLARVDMFLTPAGRIVFNEVNTIPGFTTHSRYPNMMKAAGLSFTEMLTRLMRQYL